MANTTTYNKPDLGLVRLLGYALDSELPKLVEEWKADLAKGLVSDAAKRFYADVGWLSSDRDPRLGPLVDVDEAGQEVELREPSTEPRTTRRRKPETEAQPELLPDDPPAEA